MTVDRSQLRGRDVRKALRGEQPVKPQAPLRPVSRRNPRPRLLLVAVVCGLLALACLYLVVTR